MKQNPRKIWAEEFDRQVDNLIRKGYPKIAGLSVAAFLKRVNSLRKKLNKISPRTKRGRIPFVLVVTHEWVAPESAMPLVEIDGERGSVNMDPVAPQDFSPIKDLMIPAGPVYLLVDIDTGRSTLDIRPEDALKIILKKKRSPLTIDEGVSLVIQFPETLSDRKNYNCFQMPGSRRNDQLIPSLWISYGKPRLGWCWDRNKHTWLGSASCGQRVGLQMA